MVCLTHMYTHIYIEYGLCVYITYIYIYTDNTACVPYIYYKYTHIHATWCVGNVAHICLQYGVRQVCIYMCTWYVGCVYILHIHMQYGVCVHIPYIDVHIWCVCHTYIYIFTYNMVCVYHTYIHIQTLWYVCIYITYIDISLGSLDSSLCFFQSSVSHDVLCIKVK